MDSMFVQVLTGDGEVIWAFGRDELGNPFGLTSTSYVADGMLNKIEGALRLAHEQAAGELLTFG